MREVAISDLWTSHSFQSDILNESLDLVHTTGPDDSEQVLQFKSLTQWFACGSLF